ncbi:MAG: hypothetical protein K6A65_04695 [Succinivibrionaceae bacterium]|nr:hypothetical protein [Succinivibrionaceae bacterium]
MTDINSVGSTQGPSATSLNNGNMSIQLLLAQVEMMLAKDNKAKAMKLIDGIKNQQSESKKMAETINQLRQLQQDVKDKKVSDLPTSPAKIDEELPKASGAKLNALKAYKSCAEYGLSLKEKPSADDINLLIESMKTKQEQCGTDIQQQMVFVQDYIGQYNAYSQGASSAVSQGNQTLSQLARGQ